MSPNKVCGVGMEMGYMLCCFSFFFVAAFPASSLGFRNQLLRLFVRIAVLFENIITCSGLNNMKSESEWFLPLLAHKNAILFYVVGIHNILVMYFCKCLIFLIFLLNVFPLSKKTFKMANLDILLFQLNSRTF